MNIDINLAMKEASCAIDTDFPPRGGRMKIYFIGDNEDIKRSWKINWRCPQVSRAICKGRADFWQFSWKRICLNRIWPNGKAAEKSAGIDPEQFRFAEEIVRYAGRTYEEVIEASLMMAPLPTTIKKAGQLFYHLPSAE